MPKRIRNVLKVLNVNKSKIEGKNANTLQFIGLHNEMCRVKNYPGTKDFSGHKKFHYTKKFWETKFIVYAYSIQANEEKSTDFIRGWIKPQIWMLFSNTEPLFWN